MARIDGCLQRLVSGQDCSPFSGEQAEAISQTRYNLPHGQHFHLRRCQFDGQG